MMTNGLSIDASCRPHLVTQVAVAVPVLPHVVAKVIRLPSPGWRLGPTSLQQGFLTRQSNQSECVLRVSFLDFIDEPLKLAHYF